MLGLIVCRVLLKRVKKGFYGIAARCSARSLTFSQKNGSLVLCTIQSCLSKSSYPSPVIKYDFGERSFGRPMNLTRVGGEGVVTIRVDSGWRGKVESVGGEGEGEEGGGRTPRILSHISTLFHERSFTCDGGGGG